jgi:hypothetical protein
MLLCSALICVGNKYIYRPIADVVLFEFEIDEVVLSTFIIAYIVQLWSVTHANGV